MSAQKAPLSAQILMLAGLIPFVGLALAMWFLQDDIALSQTSGLWLLVYGAVILSFLGGVRWGSAIIQTTPPNLLGLSITVLGALAGWALVLIGFRYAISASLFALMAGALVLHYVYDRSAADLPAWYRRWRVWPTFGGVLSLGLAGLSLSMS